MKILKRASSLALALMLVLSLAVPALAAGEIEVNYTGRKVIKIDPTHAITYTSTDLFGNFKGVMPGDKREETVKIANNSRSCDFIKVYMRAVPHGLTNLPVSGEEVAKAGKSLTEMVDFLNQMDLTVMNGSKEIFKAKAGEVAGTGLEKKVLLGTLRRGKSLTLNVTLEVDPDMNNDYANRAGEIDWEFIVEEYDDARPNTPKTGDDTNILPYVALLAVGAAGMFVLLMVKRKKNQAN